MAPGGQHSHQHSAQPAAGNPSVATAVGELRAQGSRITNARVAILEVLSATDAHQSAEDVAQAVNRLEPRVHRATVYRTLESLVAAGLVAHTHLGHGTAVYQLTSTPHAHCQCVRCSAVLDVPRDLLRTLTTSLRDDYGFTLDVGHSALLGLCQSCAAELDRDSADQPGHPRQAAEHSTS